MESVYKNNARYAQEHGELEMFTQSSKLNRECADTLEAAIRDGFDGMNLKMDEDIHHIFNAFGKERVEFILANTIVGKMYDGRFSRSNKEWAKAVLDMLGIDHHVEWSINAHPGILNIVVNIVRR